MPRLPLADSGDVLSDVVDVAAHVVDACMESGAQGVERLARRRTVLRYGDAGTPQKSDECGGRAEPSGDHYGRR
ncbi:hypothetical protein ABZ128_09575 [Streptomyces sp. NPDC006326]|uniref:hypothetical protein n=1 Tax=Streptomyces sp. NPDC006326 TaxID=3156752 RepID=UPI0033B40DA4